MLFLCEMEVRLPPDMPAEQADELKAREREYSQAAQRDGRWPHLWRGGGGYADGGVLDVGSGGGVHELPSPPPPFPHLGNPPTTPARPPPAPHPGGKDG